MEETILLVDDEKHARDALSIALKKEGYDVIAASSGDEGMKLLATKPVDIVITDLMMPGASGMELLLYAKKNYPNTVVIMITGYATVESAITAIKEGAFDYITKPVKLDEVRLTVQKATEKRRLVIENLLLKNELKGKYRFENIVGASSVMQDVFSLMAKVFDTDSTVLIRGESGTGKELVARAIHYNGARKDKPFVAINCAAIPGELLESELFGHVKGSFTGAVSSRPGKFELADKGTIFLDEIGSMSPHLQGKLLRAIQEKEVERVGGDRPMKVDVRIISATNTDLEQEVESGAFREDLFYRLNVIPIMLPPLRDRLDDIPLLAAHFLRSFNENNAKNIKGLGPGVLDRLAVYKWPGNVRELQNIIERAATLTEGDYIEEDSLPSALRDSKQDLHNPGVQWIPDEGLDLPKEVEKFESGLIRIALDKSDGVKSKAAALLRIKRTTLIEKIKRMGIG